MKTYTRAEVEKHNSEEDIWLIIDHKVYDCTDFIDAHPGGNVVLRQVAGTDATIDFYNLHRQEVLNKYESLCIGTIQGETPEIIVRKHGELSPVPYAEPLWLRPEFKNPYYNESHRKLQKVVRKFVDLYIYPEAQEKEADGTYISQDLIQRMVKENLIGMRLGPGKHLHGQSLFSGTMKGEDFDYFHDLVTIQEMSRINARGFSDGNLGGLVISLTAIRNWLQNVPLREKVTAACMEGREFSCLCISEAFAGSDVAGMKTTCEKSKDGKYYIINGTKKWITNGMFAQWFVTACKTDKGYNMILVPKQEGVEVTPIKTSYSSSAGTACVQYDNVKVPVDHLMGKEHDGFRVIMGNFNHERFAMASGTIRKSRTMVEECLKWSNQRRVFGKKLIDQPVIRQKLAKMISIVESNQAWLESVTYQMCQLSHSEQNKLLGGPIALLKQHSTRGAHEIADEATNIFGGRGITQSGMGKHVEMFNRTYKFDAILGGAEEILADLGVRQAMKFMPKSML